MGIALSGLIYQFLAATSNDRIQVNVSLKVIRSTEMQITTTSSTFQDTANIQRVKNVVAASQFYRNYSFEIEDDQRVKQAGWYLGDSSNTIFVEKLSFVQLGNSFRDTVFKWTPRESVGIIFNDFKHAQVEGQNARYLQIKTHSEPGPFVSIPFNELIKRKPASQTITRKLAYLGSAILFALFIILTIYKAPKLNQSIGYHFQNSRQWYLIAAFGVILLTLFLNSFLHVIPDMKNQENRKLSDAPKLSMKGIFSYPEKASSFVEEHYAFRNTFFFSNALLHAKLLGESALYDKVIMGKKGWFFENEIGSIKDLRRLTKIEKGEMEIVISTLKQRLRWLDKRGIKYYLLIPPNKNRIYPEFMPDAFKVMDHAGHCRLDYYKKEILSQTNAKIIDPTDSLYVGKKRKDVYFSTDTHWNLYGGFLGYQALMDVMMKDFPQLHKMQESDFEISESFSREGDLSGMLSLNNIYRRKEYSFVYRDTTFSLGYPESSDIFIRYSNNHTIDTANLKLLMFRDSYANYLIPFLNMHFKESVYIWNYEFMNKVVEEEKPDVIVFESLQRFLSFALTIPNSEEVATEP